MKHVLLCCLVIASTAVLNSRAFSQTPINFEHEKQIEITKIPGGEYLLHHSDLFERMIDTRVRHRLGLLPVPLPDADNITAHSGGSTVQSVERVSNISKSESNQDEPSVAISRANPKLLVAGANDDEMYSLSMPAYYSSNAGLSWRTYRLPRINNADMVAGGDPMITCDDKGTFYYAFLIYNFSVVTTNSGLSDLEIATSKDGRAWSLKPPILGASQDDSLFQDKEAIAVDCDPASPHYHRLYVVWTQFDSHDSGTGSTSETVFLGSSDDQGTSWEIHPISAALFAQIRVGKGGTVYIASNGYDDVTGTAAHFLSISKDGGKTFTMEQIAQFDDYPANGNGDNGLKGNQGFRASPYISFDVDDRDGRVYAVYGDYNALRDAAVQWFTIRATNGTWSEAVGLGNPKKTSVDRFDPWVTIDQSTHSPYVGYYSSEEDIDNVNVRMVRTTLTKPDSMEKIGDRLFDPNECTGHLSSPFIGDYICADACQGTYATVWTETEVDSTSGEIFAYVSSPSGSGVTHPIDHQGFAVGVPSPNPATGARLSLLVTIDAPRKLEITLLDAVGRTIAMNRQQLQSTGTLDLDISVLTAGQYFCHVCDGVESVTRAFVVVR